MSKPKMKVVPLESLVDDERNANRGTDRGFNMLSQSVEQFGAARSMVVDKEGRLVAGNKTREALLNAGFKDAVVIETDGKTAVVVKRPDWDLKDADGKAREYAYYDNRVAELDLSWDQDQLKMDLDDGLDLSKLFSETELSKILDATEEGPPDGFDEFDESIETQHECPKCGYEWSGKSS